MSRIAPLPAAPARIRPPADAALSAALEQCTALVTRATRPGLAFALDELAALDLPEPAAARIDRAQLRALASLYLAADLEPAGIILAVEQLASLSATGALRLDLGGAAPLLEAWWRDRNERMTAAERSAFFAQLFGTAGSAVSAAQRTNLRFEDSMLELCEALTRLEEAGGTQLTGSVMAQARVRTAARGLAQNLGDAGGGMMAFVASEVLQSLKQAFGILGHPDLRGPLHARDVWEVVAAIGRIGHFPLPDARPWVRRGKAGMLVIAWLADVLERVLGSGAVVELGDPAVTAAIDWVDATLTLGETVSETPAPPPERSAASVWSSLAG